MQDFGDQDESTERKEMSRTQAQLCSFKENRNTAGNVKGNDDDDVESAAVINSKDDEYDADNDSGTDNMEVDKKFPQGKAKIKSQKTSSVTKLTVEKACKRTDQLDNISSEEDDDIPLLSLLEDKIASQEWRQRSTEINDSDETNISSDDTTEERSSADSNCNHKQQDREAVVAETSESENSLEKLESSGHQISTASTRKDVRVKDVYSLSSTTVSTSESDRRSILPSKNMTPKSKSTPKKVLSSSSASIHNRARKSKPSPGTHSRSNRSFSTSSTECSAETSETENDSVRQSTVKTALTWKLQRDDHVIIISSDEESESEHRLSLNAKTDNEMTDRKTISKHGGHFHASDSKAKSNTGPISRSDKNSHSKVNFVTAIAVSQAIANNKDDAIEKLGMDEDAEMEGKNYEPVTPTTQMNITPQRWKIVGDQETSSDSDFVEQEQLANRAVLDKSKSKPSLEDSDSDDAFSVAQRRETKMIEGHKKSSVKQLPFLQDQDKSSMVHSKSKLPSLSRGNVQMAAGDTAKNTQKLGSKGVKFTAQYVADNIMEMDLRTSSDGSDFDDDLFVTLAAHDEAHKQAAKKKKDQHDVSNQAQNSKRTPVHMGQRTSTLIEPRTLHMYRRGSKTQTEARHPRTTRLKSHPPPMPSLHKKPPPPSPLDCSKIAKNMTQLRANLVMRELAIQEKKLQDSTQNKNPLIFNRRRSLYAENNSPADGDRVSPAPDVHEDELPGNQEKSDKETGAKKTAQTFGHRFASRTAGLAKTMSENNATVRQRRWSGKDDNTTSAVEEASHTAGEVTAMSAEASRDNHTRIENHEAAYNAEQKNDNDSKTATTFQQSTVISGPVPRERPAVQTHKNPRWSDLELPDMTKVNKVSVEDYYEKILEWNPEWISDENFDASVMPGCLEPQKVPVTFDSPQHFYAVFQPLHLLETWAKILKDWHDVKDRKVFTGKMTSSPRPLEARPSMSLLDCEVKIENRNLGALQGISECDFVRLELNLYCQTESESIVKRHAIFGIVDKVLMDKTGDYASRNKENIGDNTKCKVQFRILRMNYAVADNTIEFQVITSLIPLLRQYNSFKIPQSNVLTRHILRPITKNVYTFTASDHSAPVELTRKYNKSQECCIQGATEAAIAPYAIPRVCMIQGPPGTGKSHTIVGIVHRILKHSKQRNISMPTANSNPNLNKINILLCAPSNAAIDQLMRKLVAHLMQHSVHKQNTKYNCGDYNIVRVGREYNVHPDVRKYLLDEIVKSRIAKARSGQNDVSKLYAELKDLDDRIGEAERLCSSFKIKGDRKSLSGAEAQRDRLLKQRNELEKETKKSSSNARNLRGQESKVRQHVLVEADVVCCTLNGSGSSVLDSAVRMSKRVVFDCVIIDEACQCTELDSLIPLQYGSTKLILVGDPQQLPATVLSQNAQNLGFGQSLFERLYKFFRDHCDNPVVMLDTQYRMHKSICEFPSNQFYYGKLKTSGEVLHRTTQAKFPLLPFCVVDVVSGQERQDKPGAIINIQEAKFILEICRVISEIPRFTVNIGVITPYRAQKYHLEKQLRSEMCRGLPRIEVNTVDGFQGREKDVIILSCVRASPFGSTGIGFVANEKRLNVALTRAKYSLFIVGHLSSLETNDIWKKLIEDATSRGIVMKATPGGFRETAVKCLVEPSTHIARTSTSSDANLAKQKNNSSKAPPGQDLSGQGPSTVNSHEKGAVRSLRTFDLSGAIFNEESVPGKRKARRASLNQEKQQERSTGGANSVAAADKRKKQDGNNQSLAIRSQRKSLDEVVGQISQKYYGGSKAVTLPSDRHSKSSNVEMRKSQTKEDGHVECRAVSDDGVLQSKARGPNSLKNTSTASTEESGTAHSSSTSAFRTVESHTKTEHRRKRSSAEELRATAKLASSASKRGNKLPVTDQTQPRSKVCIESNRANQSSRDRTSNSSRETRKRKSCLTDPEEPKRSRTTKRVRFDPEVKDNTAESVRRSELYKRTHIRELPCFKKD
ncbi:probable helicase senataxin isoform X2 [Ptychodera flava]|uniref:probable helicase senataxin isoform X2 n=1 Tax=Ptychodera flava TaxID=63121 RepID=UPI00396A41F3